MTALLPASDVRDVLEILEDVSRAPTGAELMDRLLQHVTRVIPSVSASLNWFSQGRLDYVTHPPFPADDTRHFEQIMLRNWQQNPLVEHFRVTADTRALRWRDLADETWWHSTALYREFYLPLGIHDQLALRMSSPPGVAAALVVNGARPFSERDAAMLSLLGPPAFSQLSALSDRNAMRVALYDLGWSTLLVDDDGRIMRDSSVPLAGLAGSDDRIEEKIRSIALESIEADRPFGSQTVVETDIGSLTLMLARNPLPPHSLFIRRTPASDESIQLSALKMTGLSHRELDVAILMRDGATNAEIARELGITVGTVKKHLEHVFRALGVENRTAAADALWRSASLQTEPSHRAEPSNEAEPSSSG